MKNRKLLQLNLKGLFMIVLLLFSNILLAQSENENTNNENAVNVQNSSENIENNNATQTEEKKDKKKRSSFKIFGGVSFNNLDTSVDLESNVKTGFMVGASYKRGKFFYYEFGARYNYRAFGLDNGDLESSEGDFSISSLDVPLTGGINLTSYVDRLVGVRIFISAVPSFVLAVENNNSSEVSKDDVNSFIMGGQAGVGIDIAFFFIEAGYNYGFTDMLTAYSSSPSQAFVGIGFRF